MLDRHDSTRQQALGTATHNLSQHHVAVADGALQLVREDLTALFSVPHRSFVRGPVTCSSAELVNTVGHASVSRW